MRATARAPAQPRHASMSAIRRQNPALCPHRTTRPSPHHIGPSHRSMPSHHFNSAVTFALCLSLACSHHRNPSRRNLLFDLAGIRHLGGRHQPARRPRPRGSLRVPFQPASSGLTILPHAGDTVQIGLPGDRRRAAVASHAARSSCLARAAHRAPIPSGLCVLHRHSMPLTAL